MQCRACSSVKVTKSSVKVKKMSAQIEKSNCRTVFGKLTNGDSFLVKGVCASDNKNTLCEEMSEIFTEYGVVAFQKVRHFLRDRSR